MCNMVIVSAGKIRPRKIFFRFSPSFRGAIFFLEVFYSRHAPQTKQKRDFPYSRKKEKFWWGLYGILIFELPDTSQGLLPPPFEIQG